MRAPRASWCDGDGVQHLGEHLRLEAAGPFLDQPERRGGRDRAASPRRSAGRAGRGRALASAPRRAGARRRAGCRRAGGRWSWAASRQSEATPTVCSRRPPAQAWWVSCVAGRTRSRAAEVGVADEARDERPQARVGDLGGEELEEAVQLVEVARGPRARARPGRSSAGSSERTSSWSRSRKRSTRPSTRTASPSPKRLSRSSTSFQTRASILPGRVDELEREVRAAGAGAKSLLAGDRVEAFDNPVLGQLRDRHPAILGPRTDGKLARGAPAQAVSRPALRRGDGGAARRSGRSSVRRHHAGGARRGSWRGARGTRCGSSVPTTPRRPPARSPTGASAACSCARRRPAVWLARGGVHGAGRCRPHRAAESSPGCGWTRTTTASCCPTKGTFPEPKRGAPRAPARDADEAVADLPPPPRRSRRLRKASRT